MTVTLGWFCCFLGAGLRAGFAPSGGKGAGIRKVLAYYGLTPEDAMAFGDGNNDIEMFQAVGHSVAMGNASADLKAIASEVCRPCAEDGIYHYCKENGLI